MFLSFFHSAVWLRRNLLLDHVPYGPQLVHWRVLDIILIAVLALSYPLIYRIKPFQRQFLVGDLSLLHPFADPERVTTGQLFQYAVYYPIIATVVTSLVISRRAAKIYSAYVLAVGHALSVLTTLVVTDLLKNHFGRHRPDFLARCIPAENTPADILVYAADVCTTTHHDRLLDGFRTTPLGHSSIAFAGLFYSTLWLGGQLVVTWPETGAWRVVVAFLPTFGALVIALSRTEDYRHHFIDVFVGSLLGLVVAAWLYFRLFPVWTDERCYEPRLQLPEPEYEPVLEEEA